MKTLILRTLKVFQALVRMEDITLQWLIYSWHSILFNDIINLLLCAQKDRVVFRKKNNKDKTVEDSNLPRVNNF